MDPASLPSGAVVLVVVILVLAAVTVFGIAAVTVGREAHRLDAVAPRAVYVLDEAVEYVSDELPVAAQARLTPDEVRTLLRAHMAQMRSKGLQPPVAVDQVQEIVDPVVVDETDAVAYLIDQAERLHIDVTDEDVAHVVDAHLAYLAAIGAVGPVAEDDLSVSVAFPNCAKNAPRMARQRHTSAERRCHRRRPPLRAGPRCVRLRRRTATPPEALPSEASRSQPKRSGGWRRRYVRSSC